MNSDNSVASLPAFTEQTSVGWKVDGGVTVQSLPVDMILSQILENIRGINNAVARRGESASLAILNVIASYFIHYYKFTSVRYTIHNSNDVYVANTHELLAIGLPSNMYLLFQCIDSIPSSIFNFKTATEIQLGPRPENLEHVPMEYYYLILLSFIEDRVAKKMYAPKLSQLLPKISLQNTSTSKIKFK
jgi:hypothetical protein